MMSPEIVRVIENIIIFAIGWIISALAIHVSAIIVGARKNFSTALWTALIGAIIFTLFNLISWILTPIAVLVWILVLMKMYDIGLLKAIALAVIIYVVLVILSMFHLPRLL